MFPISYVGLISVDNAQVRTKALQQMLTYLVHSFPRVKQKLKIDRQLCLSMHTL